MDDIPVSSRAARIEYAIRDVVIHKRSLGEVSLPSDFYSDQCEAATGS